MIDKFEYDQSRELWNTIASKRNLSIHHGIKVLAGLPNIPVIGDDDENLTDVCWFLMRWLRPLENRVHEKSVKEMEERNKRWSQDGEFVEIYNDMVEQMNHQDDAQCGCDDGGSWPTYDDDPKIYKRRINSETYQRLGISSEHRGVVRCMECGGLIIYKK